MFLKFPDYFLSLSHDVFTNTIRGENDMETLVKERRKMSISFFKPLKFVNMNTKNVVVTFKSS